MDLQQNIPDHACLAMPTPEISKIAARWFAVVEERSRLAREIHDTVAQAFAGILLHLDAVPEGAGACMQLDSDSARRLACARRLAKSGLEDSRRMLLGLRPKSLEGASLAEALKIMAQRCAAEWRIACKFRSVGEETEISPDVQDEFYRIAQEALCNVRKHSRATSVSILLNCKSQMITLAIRDNGQGFVEKRPVACSKGFGLFSMRERARRIGGHMDINSAPQSGTEVRVRVLFPRMASAA